MSEENTNSQFDSSPEENVVSEASETTNDQINQASAEEVQKPLNEAVKPNFSFDGELSQPGQKWDDNAEFVHLPPDRASDVKETIDRLPNLTLGDTEAGRQWVQSLTESLNMIPVKEMFIDALDRLGSDWTNQIYHEGNSLQPSAPKFKNNTGRAVSGEQAVMRIHSLIGKGLPIQIPLWASGFWVTIKTPSDSALMDLYRSIGDEKVNLGRSTSGLVYGNHTVYMARLLIDFAIAHLYDQTVIVPEGKDLKDLILITDLDQLIWGLALAIWTKGFQYSRPCSRNPERCTHVTKEKINLAKISLTDRASLTVAQLSHMTKRGGTSVKWEEVEKYRNSFTRGLNRVVTVSEAGIKFRYFTPTLADHINAGVRWVDNIVSMIDNSMTSEVNERTRNVLIDRLASATTMRQWRHFVQAVIIADDEYTDDDTIDAVLDDLSSEEDIRKEFLRTVKTYLNDIKITAIAIPSFDCPACKNVELDENETKARFKRLIPIDPMLTFFTLLVPRCQNISIRTLD